MGRDTPSRADWRVLAGISPFENSRFSKKTVAVATQSCVVFVFTLFFLTLHIESNGGQHGKCRRVI